MAVLAHIAERQGCTTLPQRIISALMKSCNCSGEQQGGNHPQLNNLTPQLGRCQDAVQLKVEPNYILAFSYG